MDVTEKSDLRDSVYIMEDKKDNQAQTIVEVIDFGPLKITGNVILKDIKRDKEDVVNEIWLCRCGKSANKPYCDGSHKR